MNRIKLALSLLPLLQWLYDQDIIDVMPGSEPYIQMTEDAFRETFNDIAEDGGYLITYLSGVKILAVIKDA